MSGAIDLGRLQVFFRQRLVVQRAVAIEKPLSGRVERLAIVLQEVALVLGVGEERNRARPRQDNDVLLRHDGGDVLARDVPRVIGRDHHVAKPLGRQGRQRRKVLGIGEELAVIRFAGLAGRGIDTLAARGVHIEVEPVRCPRPHGSAAVHVQLFEVPRATPNLGDLGRPKAVGAGLEPGDLPAAAEDGPLAGIGRIRDRATFSARILGREYEGLIHAVGAATNQHQHVAARLALAEFTHRVTSAADGGQRPGLGSGIPVVTRHGDDKVRCGAGGRRFSAEQPARQGHAEGRGHDAEGHFSG